MIVLWYQPLVKAHQVETKTAALKALNTSNAAPLTLPPSPACVANVLSEYVSWLKQTPTGGTNVVRVTVASNQKNRVVSYGEGTLSITESPFPSAAGQPPATGPYALGGTLTQYFSDRRFNLGGGINLGQYPFSPQKTDQLGIRISTMGQISLTLKSWGNSTLNLTGVDCSAGLLHGLTNTSPMQSFYVISLSKDFQANAPIIK